VTVVRWRYVPLTLTLTLTSLVSFGPLVASRGKYAGRDRPRVLRPGVRLPCFLRSLTVPSEMTPYRPANSMSRADAPPAACHGTSSDADIFVVQGASILDPVPLHGCSL
jgi:hypothetical protein